MAYNHFYVSLIFGIRFPKWIICTFSHFFCIIGGGMRVRECKYKNMCDTLQQGSSRGGGQGDSLQ